MNKANFFLFALFLTSFAFAQEEQEDLGTQEVTVIKSYTPSLQDVFKLRESPQIIDSIVTPKKTVSYDIFSVPVASTFVPSKGIARKLKPKKLNSQFNSKASLAFGNFNQLRLEYTTNYAIDRDQKIDWLVYYNGLLKSMKDVQLNTRQGNALFNISHQYATNKRNSFSQINFRQHRQAFYGLRNPLEDEIILQQIEPKQQLNYLSLSSAWQWYKPLIKEVSLDTYLTTDAFSSSEVEVDFSTKFRLLLGGVSLTLLPEVTYLTTSFEEDFYTRAPIDYSAGNARVSFFASKIRGKFKFKVGAKGVYGIGDEFTEAALFVYPVLALSYRPQKGNFAPFLNLTGTLKQNSFRAFSQENPYVAPVLNLRTSDIPYEVQLGTRSKFFTGWEFQWNLFYQQNKNHPIYKSLGIDIDRTNIVPYRYANAFEVGYAALTTAGVQAQLSAAFKNGGRLQFKARYAKYSFNETTKETPIDQKTAFNLPELSLQFNGTLKVGQRLYLQWYLQHFGARQNVYRNNFLEQDLANAPFVVEDLEAFTQFDLNLQFQANERWEFFIKGQNMLNETTYRWSNYPVYGTQIMLGMRYNFDLTF